MQEHVEFFLWNPVHLVNRLYMMIMAAFALVARHDIACDICIRLAMGIFYKTVFQEHLQHTLCVCHLRNIDDPLPYSLIAAEDLVACNLVTQAVMGREDR